MPCSRQSRQSYARNHSDLTYFRLNNGKLGQLQLWVPWAEKEINICVRSAHRENKRNRIGRSSLLTHLQIDGTGMPDLL